MSAADEHVIYVEVYGTQQGVKDFRAAVHDITRATGLGSDGHIRLVRSGPRPLKPQGLDR